MGHDAAGSQLSLTTDGPRNALEQRYRQWIDGHPDVLNLFCRFAREAVERGRRFGIKLLVERVRWELSMTLVADADGFKLNNTYTAYLARDVARLVPGVADLIEFRRVKGEENFDGRKDRA